MLRILEYGTQGDSTRLGIYRTADGIDATFYGIVAATGQSQLNAGSLADEFGY